MFKRQVPIGYHYFGAYEEFQVDVFSVFDLLGRTGRKNALIVSGSSNAPPVIFNNGCHV